MDDYKTIYLKELLPLIDKVAISIMMQPQKLFLGQQSQNVESLSHLNDRIAHYNDGVRALAVVLTNKLKGDDDD